MNLHNQEKSIINPLIEKYESDYKEALLCIDNSVKELVESGKEMAGILLYSDQVLTISKIHSALSSFYSLFFNNQEVLNLFNSARFKNINHELIATSDMLKSAAGYSLDQDTIENFVSNKLKEVGYNNTHWKIKALIINEIEYMISVLKVLVEPDFIPFDSNIDTNSTEEKPDRYISSNTKIAVWRRDNGQCVECGSKEKLEYDHIIPISKGGSNTERNIQLLCEKCNRKKSANIQ